LSKLQNKNAKIYGVTPLDNIGDKYSRYEQDDFYRAIKNGFNALNLDMTNVEIITGLSQDFHVLEKVKSQSFFDIIFIDGSHDYEVVCQDVLNYVPYLKKGGYLVMDDASFYVENMPYGIFKGHPDVGKAVIDIIDKDKELEELYICGHNRVWIKL
jgi:predicted O-methyltransferase YrrM